MNINLIHRAQSAVRNAGLLARAGAEKLGTGAEEALLRGKLRRAVGELEAEIDLQFAEIGALIYATHTGTPAASCDIQEILQYVDSLFEQIEGHERQLQLLDGVRFCPACDSANAPDYTFCKDCGARLTPEEIGAESAPAAEAVKEAARELREEVAEEAASVGETLRELAEEVAEEVCGEDAGEES